MAQKADIVIRIREKTSTPKEWGAVFVVLARLLRE